MMTDDENTNSAEQDPAPDDGAVPEDDGALLEDGSAAPSAEDAVPSAEASRRRMLAAALGVALALVAAVGAWVLLSDRGAEEPPAQNAIEPAEETTRAPSATSTSSAIATSTTEDTSVAEGGPSGSGGNDSDTADGGFPKRSSMIAYRVGDQIWVGRDDGTESKAVATSTVEPYALSPDGTMLAVVDVDPTANGGRISVVDVATGETRRVGRGVVARAPSWAPDSSWLAYSAIREGVGEVHRVQADGGRDALVARPAAGPVVGPDGEHVAYRQGSDLGGGEPLAVQSLSSDTVTSVKESLGAIEWTWGRDGTLYFVRLDADGRPAVYSSDEKGSPGTLVAKRTAAGPTFALAHLCPSPTSSEVLLAEIGDDGYSRLLILKDGRFAQIATRRDAYPLCWSADGGWALYFEGNSFQGEPSRLARARPDGRDSEIIVVGASP
jgi:hypothetical protein